jgi:hypothetical protein
MCRVPEAGVSTFSTDDDQTQLRSDYFFDSADNVSVFLEPDALDAKGELVTTKQEVGD